MGSNTTLSRWRTGFEPRWGYVSILELEELASIPDTLPYCPVKEAEMALEFPVLPEPAEFVSLRDPRARMWQYRVCGIDQVIRG